MSDVTRQSFKLHLPGLLKVLAEHLYSNKQVAIRELIQNAHDSCLRRAVEGKEAHYRPRITIAADGERQVLTISDNGCGLTAEEIDAYLATIGRSYTRELRDRLSMLSWEEASRLIVLLTSAPAASVPSFMHKFLHATSSWLISV